MRSKVIIFALFILALSRHAPLYSQSNEPSQEPTIQISQVADDDILALSNEELWNMANTAYVNLDYVKAKRLYKAIVNRGVRSVDLLYNLGNAHYKCNEIAPALLNYYKAERLKPTDRDIEHNIEQARAMTKDRIEEMPKFFLLKWGDACRMLLSSTGWGIVSLVVLVILLSSLLLYLLLERLYWRRVGFTVALISTILFVVALNNALIERNRELYSAEAVVMSESLVVNSSPSQTSTELFILHAGTKVEVVSSLEGWSEIHLSDGKKGWVRSDKIKSI